jgi:mRNA interferase YafQ
MRDLILKKHYRRDVRLLQKRGYKINKLKAVVDAICIDGTPHPKCRPHKLSGDLEGYWECHIAADWLLIYDVDDTTVTLYRTGTHSDLF